MDESNTLLKTVVNDVISGNYIKAERGIEKLLSVKTHDLVSKEKDSVRAGFFTQANSIERK